jgi:hypothetical protein
MRLASNSGRHSLGSLVIQRKTTEKANRRLPSSRGPRRGPSKGAWTALDPKCLGRRPCAVNHIQLGLGSLRRRRYAEMASGSGDPAYTLDRAGRFSPHRLVPNTARAVSVNAAACRGP